MSGLPLRTYPTYVKNLGTQAAQPASGSVALRIDYNRMTQHFRLRFTFNGTRLTTTDAGASGASGSLKLFTFVKSAVLIFGSRQNYTAFAEGSALTTGAGNAAFVLGLGTVAADAGDGVLTATEVDVAAVTGTLTDSGGTTTGSKLDAKGSTAPLDGTATAKDIYLNWSGTAATSAASSTIDVTGTVTISGMLMDSVDATDP